MPVGSKESPYSYTVLVGNVETVMPDKVTALVLIPPYSSKITLFEIIRSSFLNFYKYYIIFFIIMQLEIISIFVNF
jgi:hypothetical protein